MKTSDVATRIRTLQDVKPFVKQLAIIGVLLMCMYLPQTYIFATDGHPVYDKRLLLPYFVILPALAFFDFWKDYIPFSSFDPILVIAILGILTAGQFATCCWIATRKKGWLILVLILLFFASCRSAWILADWIDGEDTFDLFRECMGAA